MTKYTKKPVTIEATRFLTVEGLKEHFPEIEIATSSNNKPGVKTLEGVMELTEGCYVIKGVKGEYYPISAEIFEMTYEVALEIPEGLPEHTQRVFVEAHEVDKKLRDLGIYISNGQPKASPEEAQLQRQQFDIMDNYSKTLHKRINLYRKN